MFIPSHPGEILLHDCIEPLGITVTEFANLLGVTRQQLSRILNQHSGISTEMALRLSYVLDTSPDVWLNLQRNYDLAVQKKNFSKSLCAKLEKAKAAYAKLRNDAGLATSIN